MAIAAPWHRPVAARAGAAEPSGPATLGCGEPATQAEALAWLAEPMRTRFRRASRPTGKPFFSEVRRVGQRQQLACLYDAYQMLAIEMAERLYAQAGLEMRQPFWNARMVEFALATPERSRLRGKEDKWLHRRAMQGLLPEDVLRRSSKAEFSVTFSRYWTELAPHMTETVLARRRDWVKPQPVRSMLQAAASRTRRSGPGWRRGRSGHFSVWMRRWTRRSQQVK